MLKQTEGTVARVTHQLSKLEKRDWELWLIVTLSSVLVSGTLLAILFNAAFIKKDGIHVELTVSRPLAIALFVLLAFLNFHLVTKRSEVRRLREQLISSTLQVRLVEEQSFTDPLTEIYNRRALDDVAGRFISHSKRRKTPLTFLMIDANRFKQINTQFGHLTGDFVLAEMAGVLKSSIRGSDAVLRYGGDEFLILLADTNSAGAHKVVDRINEKFEEWNRTSKLDGLHVSVSIGLAEWKDGDTIDEMLDSADRRMFQQKDA